MSKRRIELLPLFDPPPPRKFGGFPVRVVTWGDVDVIARDAPDLFTENLLGIACMNLPYAGVEVLAPRVSQTLHRRYATKYLAWKW